MDTENRHVRVRTHGSNSSTSLDCNSCLGLVLLPGGIDNNRYGRTSWHVLRNDCIYLRRPRDLTGREADVRHARIHADNQDAHRWRGIENRTRCDAAGHSALDRNGVREI